MATAAVPADRNDLAITYAALLLHDGGLNLTAEKLTTVLTAAGIDVPQFYTKLYVRVLANRNLDDLLMTTTAVAPSAGPVAVPGTAPVAQEEKKEEKKKVEEEEEDDALGGDGEGMGLFGGDDDY